MKIDNKLYIDHLGLTDDQYTQYSMDSYTERDRYSDYAYGVIEIYGSREETDEAYDARLERIKLENQKQKEAKKKQKESMEAMDRMLYEKQKKKYEN